jgi:hypothetical protein
MKPLSTETKAQLVQGAGFRDAMNVACSTAGVLRVLAIYSNPLTSAFCVGWGIGNLVLD